ncbi:MAG: hypothetical protein CMJ29_10760 [Phycisphaerae bacterium]|nr:hypothetical protein [Phycisphaerae bacterium]
MGLRRGHHGLLPCFNEIQRVPGRIRCELDPSLYKLKAIDRGLFLPGPPRFTDFLQEVTRCRFSYPVPLACSAVS